MISLDRVRFGYRDDERVLEEVSLELPAGLTLLVGPNGSGKSTLMKLMAGVERPDQGAVRVGGHDLWESEVAARRLLAYVPERPDLTPYASIGEVLDLVCRLRGEEETAGAASLKRLDLGGMERRSIRELSLGQQRRVLLAAARIGRPRVLLVDEPLEAMDAGARESILSWLDEAVRSGAAVVVATHELDPFLAATERVLSIRAGAVTLKTDLPAEPGDRLRCITSLAAGRSPAD